MSYSAIRGSKVTLPSVEGGFGSMNILKDPPKSIHTSYKPKISDTTKLNELIDQSGDRVCEAIQKFARGVNPMVSVSYSNHGTGGGQSRGGDGLVVSGLHQGQSYLPYRIARDGAFRPPIIPPEQLKPLSRLPRRNVQVETNQGSNLLIDFEQQTQCSGLDLKALRNELLKTYDFATPKTFSLQTTEQNPSQLTSSTLTETPLNAQAHTNKYDPSIYKLGINSKVEKGIHDKTLYGSISVNNSRNIQLNPTQVLIPEKGLKDIHQIPIHTNQANPAIQTHLNHVSAPERGIKDAIQCEANSNPSIQNRGTPIEQVLGNQPIRLQDKAKLEWNTVKTSHDKHAYIHQEKQLDRNTPIVSMSANRGLAGVDLNQHIQSREFRNLPTRSTRGAFQNTGFQPTFNA